MLVLTRKVQESITIILPDDSEVKVMVTRLLDNKVRLGVEAPRDVRIMRSELVE